jgi:transketolase
MITALERRILDLSYKHKLSHIGSCLTAVGIIDEIYAFKLPYEKFVLSCGHAGLALYVVLEKHNVANAEYLLEQCGVHPDRILGGGAIDCSTGSLGQGLPIALGMALANRDESVYCLVSDGECSEGSAWEAVNNAGKFNVENLKIYCNSNGFSAYDETFIFEDWPFQVIDTSRHWFMKLYGQEAHYKILNQQEYEEAIRQ